jgi:hypothetical protein
MKGEFNKDREILKKKIKFLKMKNSVTKIKTQLKI